MSENKKVLGITSGVFSFIIEKVFGHRVSGLVPQYFESNFKSCFWAPAKARMVSVSAFGKSIVKDYILPKNMSDTAIQTTNNSTSMSEDAMWAMLYLLVIDPKLGKKILKYKLRKNKVYICHVQLAGRDVAVCFGWDGVEWCFFAFMFDNLWNEGFVFLYPANVKSL